MTDEKNLQDENAGKIQELEKRAQEYLDGWKRAKADYINLKKETDEKTKEMFEFAAVGFIFRLIPLSRNFEEAFKHLPENINYIEWVKGIEQIKKQLEGIFFEMGLMRIETVGKKFNPEFHEAVSHEAKEGAGHDTIIEEISAGYMLNGKTIAPAKVKVAK